VAAALRGAGLRAALDLGPVRNRRALIDYAGQTGFSRVLELAASGASWSARWIDRSGAITEVAAGPLRRAIAGDGTALVALSGGHS
jgi:hypothetical protein